MPWNRRGIVPVLFVLCLLASCAWTYTGTKFDKSKIDTIVIGVTTREEIEGAFGKPDAVSRKAAEDLHILSYKYIRISNLGIPWLLSVGRTSSRGHQLSVVISGSTGKVVNYEVTELMK